MSTISRRLLLAAPARRRDVEQRLRQLLPEVGGSAAGDIESLFGELETVVLDDPRDAWFSIAVLSAVLPTEAQVVEALRRAALFGTVDALSPYLALEGWRRLVPPRRRRTVEIVRDGILVDVDHTSTVDFATGIQRVVRESVRRWDRDHSLTLVGWLPDRSGLRRLDPSAADRALHGARDGAPAAEAAVSTVLVPRTGTYLLPELVLESSSIARIAALARFSGLRTGTIGYDAVPLSSSETVNVGVSGRFATYLSAVKWFDRVTVISDAAAGEYEGWRGMLAGAGITGPSITPVILPAEAPDSVLQPGAADDLVLPSLPLVLSVGSHEPRKNHLAVLHAAELLWREGLEFQLVFVGGNAWGSERFAVREAELAAAGRPVRSVQGVSDSVVWDLYRRAAFTVFPSLNEGFGLPVAESLSVGTPAITSGFGSMAEIAADGGALLVDPHDDHDLASGMRTLLTDATELARLRSAALARPTRSWDDYAAETWTALMETKTA